MKCQGCGRIMRLFVMDHNIANYWECMYLDCWEVQV